MQQEIVEETDIFEDVNTGLRRGGPRVDVANFLAMFEHKLNHFQVLTRQLTLVGVNHRNLRLYISACLLPMMAPHIEFL